MEKAIQGFKEVLAREPRDVTALNYLAETLASTGQYDAAVQIYDRLLEVQPTEPTYQLNKAWIPYIRTGDTKALWSAIAHPSRARAQRALAAAAALFGVPREKD